MIGRRCRGRRSAAEVLGGSTPVIAGATLNRPARFMAKPEPVRAVWHDGSDAQLAVVTEWVQQVHHGLGMDGRGMEDREVRVELEPGPVLVIRPAWPAESVRRSTGWTVYSAEQFLAAFEPLPRELPIFDDGEVA